MCRRVRSSSLFRSRLPHSLGKIFSPLPSVCYIRHIGNFVDLVHRYTEVCIVIFIHPKGWLDSNYMHLCFYYSLYLSSHGTVQHRRMMQTRLSNTDGAFSVHTDVYRESPEHYWHIQCYSKPCKYISGARCPVFTIHWHKPRSNLILASMCPLWRGTWYSGDL